MSPISKVLLLATMLFTSDGFPLGNHSVDINPSADDPKIHLNGSVDGHLINLHRSAEDYMISPNLSASDHNICSPNPCGPASICLICDAHNCPNQTTKDHFCLCWRDQQWKNCDDSSEKVPQNICDFVNICGTFGSCATTSFYPGYECQCDDKHVGANCELEKMTLGLFCIVFFGTVWVVVWGLILCCCGSKKQSGTDQQLQLIPPTLPDVCQGHSTPNSSAVEMPIKQEPNVTGSPTTWESLL